MSHDLTTEQIDLLTSIMMAHEADPEVLTLGTALAIRQIGLTGPAATREARALAELGLLGRVGPTIHLKPEAHAWWASRNGRSVRAATSPEATPTPSSLPSLRERILAWVDEHPWSGTAAVCEGLGAARGSVAPALSAAAKAGSLITVPGADGLTLYARVGTSPPEAWVEQTVSPAPTPQSGLAHTEALRQRAEAAELELFRVRSSLEASVGAVPEGVAPTTLDLAQIIEARLTPAKGARLCYVAAPLSGATAREVRWNIARAQLLGEVVACRGFVPVVPHLMLAPLYLRDDLDADEPARAAGLRACAELLRAVLAFGGVLHCLTRDDGSMSDGCALEWELTPEGRRQSGTWDHLVADLRRRVGFGEGCGAHLDRATALDCLDAWQDPEEEAERTVGADHHDLHGIMDSYDVPSDEPAGPVDVRLRGLLCRLTDERDGAQAEAERLRAELDATRSTLARMDAAAQLSGARSRNMCRTIRSIGSDVRNGRLAPAEVHDEVRAALREIEQERLHLSVALGTLDMVAGPVEVAHG